MTDVKQNLAALMALVPEQFKMDLEGLGGKFREKPAQHTLVIMGAAAYVFYLAERSVNPKVKTIFDALEYCSSSLSVGYTNIYPQTPIGKSVATLLMTFGPAMSGAILDGTKKPDPTQERILVLLEQILAQLQANAAAGAGETAPKI